MPGDVTITMSLEQAKAMAALTEVIAKQSQQEAGLGGIVKRSQEAARAQEELGRAAKRVLNEIATPQERFATKQAELNRLFQAGALNQEQYGRAMQQTRGAMEATGEVTESAFGPKAGAHLLNFAAGLTGISISAASVLAGMVAIRKEQEEASQRDREKRGGYGQLGAVATSPGEASRLRDQAVSLFKTGSFGTEGEAAATMAAMKTAGLADQASVDWMKRAGTAKLYEDPAKMARAIGVLFRARGAEAGVSMEAVAGKMFVAAEGSGLKPDEFAGVVAQSAMEAKLAGVGTDDQMAILASINAVVNRRGQAAMTVSAAKALFHSLLKPAAPKVSKEIWEGFVGTPEEEAYYALMHPEAAGKSKLQLTGKTLPQILASTKGKSPEELKGAGLPDEVVMALVQMREHEASYSGKSEAIGTRGPGEFARHERYATEDPGVRAAGLRDRAKARGEAVRQGAWQSLAESVFQENMAAAYEELPEAGYLAVLAGTRAQRMFWTPRAWAIRNQNLRGVSGPTRAGIRYQIAVEEGYARPDAAEVMQPAAEVLENAGEAMLRSQQTQPTLGRPDEDK
jgi:hypothetical protein